MPLLENLKKRLAELIKKQRAVKPPVFPLTRKQFFRPIMEGIARRAPVIPTPKEVVRPMARRAIEPVGRKAVELGARAGRLPELPELARRVADPTQMGKTMGMVLGKEKEEELKKTTAYYFPSELAKNITALITDIHIKIPIKMGLGVAEAGRTIIGGKRIPKEPVKVPLIGKISSYERDVYEAIKKGEKPWLAAAKAGLNTIIDGAIVAGMAKGALKEPLKKLKMSPDAARKVLNMKKGEAVKDAYYRLSRRYHPDRGGDPKIFKQINDAYQTLTGQRPAMVKLQDFADTMLRDIGKMSVPAKMPAAPEGLLALPGKAPKVKAPEIPFWRKPLPIKEPRVKVPTGGLAVEEVPPKKAIVPEELGINIEKIKTIPGGKKVLERTVRRLKPKFEKIEGKEMSQEEVLKEAQRSVMLRRATTRESQLKANAGLLKLRQHTASLSNKIDKLGKNASPELWDDYIRNLEILKSHLSSRGRALESLKIPAEDVKVENIKEDLIKEVLKKETDIDKVVEAAKKVDFGNTLEAQKFYRQFVKPTKTEIIDWFRYNNMLSSPKTWIINLMGNLFQFPIKTAIKLASGPIDILASAVKPGRPRRYYTREVGPYVKGFVGNIPDATKEFVNVMKGTSEMRRPDVPMMRYAPFTSLKSRLYAVPTRIMEAGDAFFKILFDRANIEALTHKYTRAGKEIIPEEIQALARKETLETLFRQPLGAEEQGTLLKQIDRLSAGVYQLRKIPGIGWIVPFIQTTMNILKQGIELSPAGVATIPGTAAKVPQVAKPLIGSVIFLIAGSLALEDRTTWRAPRGKKEKQLFYASGKKPYSIKIGETWVSYSKIGPAAYPIAMAAVLKYAYEKNPTQSTIENIGTATFEMTNFFSDQSYVQGIADLMDVMKGEEFATKRWISGLTGQIIPWRAFLGFITRITDNVYRAPKTFTEMLMSQLPLLSKQVPPYREPTGEESTREHPLREAFLPWAMGEAKPKEETTLEAYQLEQKGTRIQNQIRDIANNPDLTIEERIEQISAMGKSGQTIAMLLEKVMTKPGYQALMEGQKQEIHNKIINKIMGTTQATEQMKQYPQETMRQEIIKRLKKRGLSDEEAERLSRELMEKLPPSGL